MGRVAPLRGREPHGGGEGRRRGGLRGAAPRPTTLAVVYDSVVYLIQDLCLDSINADVKFIIKDTSEQQSCSQRRQLTAAGQRQFNGAASWGSEPGGPAAGRA